MQDSIFSVGGRGGVVVGEVDQSDRIYSSSMKLQP